MAGAGARPCAARGAAELGLASRGGRDRARPCAAQRRSGAGLRVSRRPGRSLRCGSRRLGGGRVWGAAVAAAAAGEAPLLFLDADKALDSLAREIPPARAQTEPPARLGSARLWGRRGARTTVLEPATRPRATSSPRRLVRRRWLCLYALAGFFLQICHHRDGSKRPVYVPLCFLLNGKR